MEKESSQNFEKERFVDYTDQGWKNIDFKQKTVELLGIDKSKIKQFSELQGGFFNKVLLVETEDDKLVIKISPHWNKHGLSREHFVNGQLKERPGSFRKPEILSFTPPENATLPGHNIIVMKYIDGHSISEEELHAVDTHKKLSSFLSAVHEIPIQGYGWLNKDLNGSDETWQNFLQNIDNLQLTKESNLLSVDSLSRLTDDLSGKCGEDHPPKLLYGDLKSENIIVKEPEIYLLDYENCFAGHETYDTGIGLFFIPAIEKNLPIYLGHEPSTREHQQIILYAMRHAVSCLGHRISAGLEQEQHKAVERFLSLERTLLDFKKN